ncbi:MAG: radical SAM protein, partial [Desulfobacterales bacterium]
SRGCPFKCIFCVGRKMVGAKVRYRSPQRVVDEMQYLNTLNFHQINIADDLFTANKTHCMAVCEEIIKRKTSIKWTSFARVDTVTDEIITRMKAAGCTGISFGIESANEKILKTIKKGIARRQVVDAVNMCNQAGVTPYGSFILGLPGETPQTIDETLEFGKQLKKMGLSFGFHLLAPFPGTEVRKHSQKYGINILTNDWSEYHANRAIVETPMVHRNMLDDIVNAWKNEYDGYLEDIKNRMQTGQATADEIWEVRNLERIVLIYDLMMKNLIEKRGHWQIEENPLPADEALNGLVRNITNATAHRPADIHQALQHAVAQGNLIFRSDDGQLKWQWVDHL